MRRDTYLQVACSEIATISSPARNPRRIGDARTSRHSRRTVAGRTTSASAASRLLGRSGIRGASRPRQAHAAGHEDGERHRDREQAECHRHRRAPDTLPGQPHGDRGRRPPDRCPRAQPSVRARSIAEGLQCDRVADRTPRHRAHERDRHGRREDDRIGPCDGEPQTAHDRHRGRCHERARPSQAPVGECPPHRIGCERHDSRRPQDESDLRRSQAPAGQQRDEEGQEEAERRSLEAIEPAQPRDGHRPSMGERSCGRVVPIVRLAGLIDGR